jgi:L,D-transpeptidase ErfK/SrfK
MAGTTLDPVKPISPMTRYVFPLLTLFILTLAGSLPLTGHAATWPMPSPDDEVIGEISYEHARRSDTLMDIARWLSMGYREIRRANPDVDLWVPGEGTRVLIPSKFVLPDGPREGIVINRAEKRLYYFRPDPETGEPAVTTYPIGIGKAGRETPVGHARVTQRLENPAWYPTEGVRADYRSRGLDLPPMVPPGPDNPLGRFALILDMPGYLIHGTHRPDGVGMRVSQGCVRLYPEHIEELVFDVPIGTPVAMIDQPVKAGYLDGRLYLEIHPGHDDSVPEMAEVRAVVERAWQRNRDRLGETVDWQRVEEAWKNADGVPRVISSIPRS